MTRPTFYDICYLIVGACALPWVMARKKRGPDGWRERWGRRPEPLRQALSAAAGGVWIHSVSLGEAKAARPLVEALHAQYPGVSLILTAVTRTGLDALKPLARAGDVAAYVPFDVSWALEEFLRLTRPGLLLMMEKELWPGLIRAASQHGVPMLLINGRLSQRSLRRYRRIRWAIAGMLSRFDRVLVQTVVDQRRFQELGAPADRCAALGNLKFDAPPLTAKQTSRAKARRQRLGIGPDDVLWIGGSTHRGEEETVLSVYRSLRARHRPVRLLLAPRHVERVEDVERLVRADGLEPRRISTLGPRDGEEKTEPAAGRQAGLEVWVLDTSGDLADWYGAADVAFVGGSLIPHGGQNILEPAAWGLPIVTGPYTENFEAMVESFVSAGACRVVKDSSALLEVMEELLRSRELRERMGQTARTLRKQASGATARVMEQLRPYLDRLPRSAAGPQEAGEREPEGSVAPQTPKPVPSARPMSSPARAAGVPSHGGSRSSSSFVAWQHRLRWLLVPLSWVYGGLVWLAPRLHAVGLIKRYEVDCPVISVGNLTWGGTGKTPLVRELVDRLIRHGHRPAVISRGYAGEEGGADEVRMLAGQLNTTAIVADADRVRGARRAVADGADVLVLDDGFQHWRLGRSLDIVTVNARNPFGNHRLIPAGPLRESKAALARADVVVLTRSNELDDASREALRHTIRRYSPRAELLDASYAVSGLRRLADGPDARTVPADALGDAPAVALVSGIADPDSFERTVRRLGGTVVRRWDFPDHHRYAPDEIAEIQRDCAAAGVRAVLTTEKDAVKLDAWRTSFARGCDWYAVCVTLEVEDPHGTLAARLAAGLHRSLR